MIKDDERDELNQEFFSSFECTYWEYEDKWEINDHETNEINQE